MAMDNVIAQDTRRRGCVWIVAPYPPAPFPRIGGKGGLVLKRGGEIATF